MTVTINNKETEIEDGLTVSALLERQRMKKAAVWINGEQLKKAEYAERVVQSGDQIKLLRIVAGG